MNSLSALILVISVLICGHTLILQAAKGGKQQTSTLSVQAMLIKRHAHQHVIRQPSTASEEPSVPIVSSKATSASRELVTVDHTGGKRKLSKAERKRLKKGAKRTGRRETPKAEKQEDYRDPQYYIGATPAGYDAESERHLSVHAKRDDDDSGIGKNELSAAVLDLAGDDQKGTLLV